MSKEKITISELNDLCKCVNMSLDEVSEENKTMKEIQNNLENIILETYHKYQIYFSKSDSTWRTYIPDETKTNKRKLIKRKNKEDLEKFLVNHYKELYLDKSRKNTKLRELYKEWMIYRRNETSAKVRPEKISLFVICVPWHFRFLNLTFRLRSAFLVRRSPMSM